MGAAMQKPLGVALAVVAFSWAADQAYAQRVEIAPGQQYAILEITKLSTLAAELNDAAKQGFRLRMTAVESPRVSALMAREEAGGGTYEYQIVNAFSSKTGDKEMNEAASNGFRVVPGTFMVKKGLTVFNVDNVVVMEKSPGSSEPFEYLTLNAARTSTLDKELKDALAQGWRVLDMVHRQILLERTRATR